MASQIILEWTVDAANTPLSAADAATKLAAVKLYDNPLTDPVLGQFFGLAVEADVTATSGPTTVTRTLTLGMVEEAGPPSFPCHPRTSTPPQLPYPLRKTVTLPGSFFAQNGNATVQTTDSMIPSLVAGDFIQFVEQKGVFYQLAGAPTPTSITIIPPYSGTTTNTGAFKDMPAPVTRAAVYSTSPLDTDTVSTTTPAIPPGPGAQQVVIEYMDSTGSTFGIQVPLNGKRPAAVTLDPMSVDIAVILEMFVFPTGSFGNSVGQITLCELSEDLPGIPARATPDDFRGKLTDEAQALISNHLVYLPPSYFALARQGAALPQLAGDFFVTTGSVEVPTSVDQSSALAQEDQIQFASQMENNTAFGKVEVIYTVATVSSKIVTLTTPYRGLDDNFTGTDQLGTNADAGTKGNVGTKVLNKATGAQKVGASVGAPPTNDQLSGPLGQFVQPAVAAPPPNPPLAPASIPTPTFLSDLFTQTLQLALAGVPITPSQITFS